MLYLTTRGRSDAYTPARALQENRSPDGGLYVPRQEPDLRELAENAENRSSYAIIAQVLNTLLDSHLSPMDVEFALGAEPFQVSDLDARTRIAELWHNPDGDFLRHALNLKRAVVGAEAEEFASDWLKIAARIALLTALTAAMQPKEPLDLVVPSGDFSAAMAAEYGKSWGLPIDRIIVCCNENNGLWNLFHLGEIRTEGTLFETSTPECDYLIPPDLERLLCRRFGRKEALRFALAQEAGKTFYLEENQLPVLKKGMYITVVGMERIPVMISSMKLTQGYDAGEYTALCYVGLLDFRARHKGSAAALILDEKRKEMENGAVRNR